jgi:hypothetical protein
MATKKKRGGSESWERGKRERKGKRKEKREKE